MTKPRKRPRPHVPPPTDEQAQALLKRVEDRIYLFVGNFDELESAIGMLFIGPLVGWRVLALIHNKRTIRNYEKILDIKIREVFPEEGPLYYKSVGYEIVQKLQKFWKGVSGEIPIENRRELIAALDAVFVERDQWDWVNHLCTLGLPVAPVQDYGQLVDDAQVVANGYVVEFGHPRDGHVRMVGPAAQLELTPGSIRRPAPEFGEHTEEVLLEAGLTWDDIARLKDDGAIGPR